MTSNQSEEKIYQVEKVTKEAKEGTVQRVYSVEVLPHLKESNTTEQLLSSFGVLLFLLLLFVAIRKKVQDV